jgi:eukaryotic-like serine/threonine-protein kinase
MIKFLRSRIFLIQICLALVFTCLCVYGAYLFLNNYAKTGEAIEVPNLEGLDIIEAEAALKSEGLYAEIIDSLYQQGDRGGLVLDQEPRATSLVKKDRKIYLTISRYQTPTVIVPNVLNQSIAIAINKLTRRGFLIGQQIPKPDPCNGCPIGLEIRGKKILEGTKLPKGTKIDLIIGMSDDEGEVLAPALYGLTPDEAKLLLTSYGLNVGALVITDAMNNGDSLAAKVYDQSEKPGTFLKTGSAIGVFASPDILKLPNVNLDSVKASIQ